MSGFKGFLTTALTWLALLAIRGYQRWLSPYKGFHCAYRVYHGGSEGCSGYGRRVIGRYGVFTGYRLLQRRMGDCSAAAELLQEQRIARVQMARAQAGFCDGCDLDCALPDCDISDWLSGCVPDCGDSCDVWSEEKPKQDKKKVVPTARAEAGHCDLPSVDCDFSDVLSLVGDCAPKSCGSSRTSTYRRKKKYQPLPKRI